MRLAVASYSLVAILVGFAYGSVASGLNPASLYLDDQWVADLAKTSHLAEVVKVFPAAPLGFIFVERISQSFISDPELCLQAAPLLFFLVAIVCAYYVGRLLGKDWAMGLVFAALVAQNPLLASYSIRAKQYSLDVVVILILSWLFLRWRESHEPRDFRRLCWVSAMGFVFSFCSVFFSFLAVNAVLLWAILNKRDDLKNYVVSWFGYGAFTAFYSLYARLQSPPGMYTFWRPYYLPVSSLSASKVFLDVHLSQYLFEWFMPELQVLGYFVVPGLLLGVVWKETRGFTLLL